MPMPWAYRDASRDWRGFLDDVREVTGLPTDHTAYTAIDGVFRCFRRRLTVAQAIAFAGVLPAVPRAVFVQDWNIALPPEPWTDRASLAAEVAALRRAHNIAPANSIEATARALWRRTNHADLERVLGRLGSEARAFWAVPGGDPSDLAMRIA